jgi:hypothetical protein
MSKSFDELSRALATGTNRRSALRGVLAGAFGAAVATMLPGRTAEATKEEGLAVKLCKKYCKDTTDTREQEKACIAECAATFKDKDDENEPFVDRFALKELDCIGVCLNSTVVNGTQLRHR